MLSIMLNAQVKLGADSVWQFFQFDTSSTYLKVDTSAQNIWQIGQPQKVFFDSAYSPKNAIVTDTVDTYPANNHSWFDIYVGKFNNDYYPNIVFFEMKHKFDTDSLEGGYISVSWDNGATWNNIIHDTAYHEFMSFGAFPGMYINSYDTNLYLPDDTLFNGQPGFSGHSQGWKKTIFSWYLMAVKKMYPDTMRVRFNFVSDSVDNGKEGWMIDDIKLYTVKMASGINERFSGQFEVFPNPATTSLKITSDKILIETVELYNLKGQKLLKKSVRNKNADINVSTYEAGVYLLVIHTNNGIASKRILIQN